MATDHFHSIGAVLGTAKAAVYTVPEGRQAVAILLQATNVAAANATVNVTRFDYARGVETQLATGVSLAPGGPQEVAGRLALRQGDELRAWSDTADAVHLTLSTAQSDTGETFPLTATPVRDGLVVELDASNLELADGAAVDLWSDASGSGNDVSQTDAALQPVYEAAGLGGKPAVYFNGDRLVGPGTTVLVQPNTVFIVATEEGGAEVSERYLFDGTTGTQRHIILDYETNGGEWRYFAGALTMGSPSDALAHLWGAIFDGANSVARKDGVQDAAGDTGTHDFALLTVGGPNPSLAASNAPQIGRTAELLVYNRRLTDPEVADVEQYLADKYGLTLG